MDLTWRTRRHRGLLMSARYPRKVSTEHVNCKRSGHQDRAYPESPVAMHSAPVRTRIGLTRVTAVSFWIVLVSSHLFSNGAMFREPNSFIMNGNSLLHWEHYAHSSVFLNGPAYLGPIPSGVKTPRFFGLNRHD